MSVKKSTKKAGPKKAGIQRKSILDLSHDKARAFFLKQDSYCNLEMPQYIVFRPILEAVNKALSSMPLESCKKEKPKDRDDINYTILSNKDGKYAWRPIQLIHPALYVALVHRITRPDNWAYIVSRFEEFSKNTSIHCLSIPVVSLSKQKDRAEQILQWWQEIEQRSFELSLEFEYLIDTDLTDCYGSIYTHSISWALHDKNIAKSKRNDKNLIGNIIDDYIQDMRFGQTNGIPQGSILMDFIAEMLLGYADRELSIKLDDTLPRDRYCILRYRDDYRIFVNDSQDGELIVKFLTETMIDLGLKLNFSKTRTSDDVVHSSMKRDKLSWIEKKVDGLPYYKSLMVIHEHAKQFPNSGSLLTALSEFHGQISKDVNKKCPRPLPLIGIIVDIAYRNPKAYPVCAAILSVLFSVLPKQERAKIVEKVLKKFDRIPNTGYMEIWLQRVTISSVATASYKEPICHLVDGKKVSLWNTDWISSKTLRNAVDTTSIVDQKQLDRCGRTKFILAKEIALFLEKIEQYNR